LRYEKETGRQVKSKKDKGQRIKDKGQRIKDKGQSIE
jgi:hypothetical protein